MCAGSRARCRAPSARSTASSRPRSRWRCRKSTEFLGNSPKPSGSVLVRLRPGTAAHRRPGRRDRRLVASSVPGLARENVTIVDQTGAVLSAERQGRAAAGARSSSSSRAQINRRYEALITDLLVAGARPRQFPRFRPTPTSIFRRPRKAWSNTATSHVLSQDETIHIRDRRRRRAAGRHPGALSNSRPDNPTTKTTAPPPPPAPNQPADQARPERQTSRGKPRRAASAARPTRTARRPITTSTRRSSSRAPVMEAARRSTSRCWSTTRPASPIAGGAAASGQQAGRLGDRRRAEPACHGGRPAVRDRSARSPSMPGARGGHSRGSTAVGQNGLLALAGMLALFGGVLPLLRRVTAGLQRGDWPPRRGRRCGRGRSSGLMPRPRPAGSRAWAPGRSTLGAGGEDPRRRAGRLQHRGRNRADAGQQRPGAHGPGHQRMDSR